MEIYRGALLNSLDASDTTLMGRSREAVAAHLLSRDKSLRYSEFAHSKYVAAMSAGAAYTNSQDLVNQSTEQFRDILYNIDDSSRKRVESPEDVRHLWEQVMGKPWPTKDTESASSDDTETNQEDN